MALLLFIKLTRQYYPVTIIFVFSLRTIFFFIEDVLFGQFIFINDKSRETYGNFDAFYNYIYLLSQLRVNIITLRKKNTLLVFVPYTIISHFVIIRFVMQWIYQQIDLNNDIRFWLSRLALHTYYFVLYM